MIQVVDNKVMWEEAAYNFIKKFVQLVLPALATLYFALAQIWHLPDATQVIGSLTAVATFFGVTLHISSTNYNNSADAHDGTVSVAPTDTGSTLSLHLDPSDVARKHTIHLKVVPHDESKKLPADSPRPARQTAVKRKSLNPAKEQNDTRS